MWLRELEAKRSRAIEPVSSSLFSGSVYFRGQEKLRKWERRREGEREGRRNSGGKQLGVWRALKQGLMTPGLASHLVSSQACP